MTAPGPSSLASLDGEIMPAAEAMIPATDEGLIRGDGVFEVIRVYDGSPSRSRSTSLGSSARRPNLRLALDLEAVRADAHRLLAQAGGGPDHERCGSCSPAAVGACCSPSRCPTTPERARLMTITYSPTRILDGVKSLSYAANMLASRLAREAGFDEALLVTPHGRVLEAPTSSIFWVDGEEILTPPLDDHILASITRALVIEMTGAQERACPLEKLLGADEVFLASTAREVQPVVAVDDQAFDAPGPVTERIADAGPGAHPARSCAP